MRHDSASLTREPPTREIVVIIPLTHQLLNLVAENSVSERCPGLPQRSGRMDCGAPWQRSSDPWW